ncbi:hypothetical protein [Halocalculus aciditolerans]|uniref:Uncharacterized protein n=1 Tax=Halocalculus aciditolerans TaxID=1383812 RepID=A0A830FNM2_9EURY|nr:hypothetical protein [Halocalculus aciditolerans]GGL73631.1 hypothetical protein GCM10009039_34650 [Halocalculus aciditolerans]
MGTSKPPVGAVLLAHELLESDYDLLARDGWMVMGAGTGVMCWEYGGLREQASGDVALDLEFSTSWETGEVRDLYADVVEE